MTIRFATSADISGILQLLYQVGDVHHQIRPDIFRAGALKYDALALQNLLQDSNRPIFVAVEGDALLGYCFCVIKDYRGSGVQTDRVEVYIDDLCVEETCRCGGVGKALYHAVLDYARGIGAYNVTLNVWAKNESALKFYEKMGLLPQKYGMETIL